MNPDVRFDKGCIRALVEVLADPTIGIAVPNLRNVDGRLAFSLRRDPTVLRAFGDTVLGGGRAGAFALSVRRSRTPTATRLRGTWTGPQGR